MNQKKSRRVTQTPLKKLWNETGDLSFVRKDFLTRTELLALIQSTAMQFVVAAIFSEIVWVPENDTLEFWEREVSTNLASDDEEGFDLSDYPNNYAYVASEWLDAYGKRVVLLEVHH